MRNMSDQASKIQDAMMQLGPVLVDNEELLTDEAKFAELHDVVKEMLGRPAGAADPEGAAPYLSRLLDMGVIVNGRLAEQPALLMQVERYLKGVLDSVSSAGPNDMIPSQPAEFSEGRRSHRDRELLMGSRMGRFKLWNERRAAARGRRGA